MANGDVIESVCCQSVQQGVQESEGREVLSETRIVEKGYKPSKSGSGSRCSTNQGGLAAEPKTEVVRLGGNIWVALIKVVRAGNKI